MIQNFLQELEQEGLKEIFNYTEVNLSIRNKQHPEIRDRIISSSDAAAYVKNLFGMDIETKEMFFAVMMNNAYEVLSVYKISTGGINACFVDTRLIFSAALHCLATNIFVCHNHPSGRTNPSKADLEMTEQLKQACDIMQINLSDHIIVSEYDHYSFAENGNI